MEEFYQIQDKENGLFFDFSKMKWSEEGTIFKTKEEVQDVVSLLGEGLEFYVLHSKRLR